MDKIDSYQSLKECEKEIEKIDKEIHNLKRRKEALVRKQKQIKEAEAKNETEKLQNQNWDSKTFPWSESSDQHLSSTFKLSGYRPHQLSTLNAYLSGHDVFLIMPTGGGKSLCYQLPALVSKGLTLVVSPLVALMEDQVMALKRLEIPAEMLNADTSKSEVTRILNNMVDPKSTMKLLYVTPEKLAKSKRFMTKLQNSYKLGLFSNLAIDEVHCCSQWGHDFRPDYKFLGVMKNLFPKVPIMGLTATSTSRVTQDCQNLLNLKSCLLFRAEFNRPNLFYEVRPKPDSHDESVEVLSNMLSREFKNQSGIIYALTIKDVESLAKDLRAKGVRVAPYHAQLSAELRSRVHRRWLCGEYQAVVATIAFGMGIDKPDVRFVIHHAISKSMENFYQESGRAGRDSDNSKCIAFFKFGDVFRISTMVFTEQTGLEKLYGMLAYSTDFQSCRRSIIAQHFGEVWETKQCNKMCDNCASEKKFTNLPLKEYVKALKSILLQSESMDAKLTGLKLVNALMGRGEGKFKVANWSPPKTFTKTIAEQVILHLLMEGYLKEDFAFTPYSTISYIVRGHIDMNFAEDGVISVLDSQTEAKSKKVGNSKPAPKRKKANLDGDEESSKKSKTNVSTEEDLICIESD